MPFVMGYLRGFAAMPYLRFIQVGYQLIMLFRQKVRTNRLFQEPS